MPNQPHKELNEKLVQSHLCDVTDEDTAWILLQEPGFIGFGAVYQDKIYWPPYVQQLDWTRIRDLRLFGEKGEWHVWPHWKTGWNSRFLKVGEITDAFTEYHSLWGTRVECGQSSWIKLVEDRGAEIWLPLAETHLKESDLPLRLKLKQIVSYDSDSRLAGIVDAALIGIVQKSCEELLLPTGLPSCS